MLPTSQILCKGIHWWQVDFPHNGLIMWSLVEVFFVSNLNKLLKKQWYCQWFETMCCTFEVTVMMKLWYLNCLLTHCGLVTLYGDRFDGINYQAITWTSEDFSSKVFCGIHLRAISQEMLINFTCNMCLEIALKFFNHYHISQGLMSLYILNEAKKIDVWHLLHIFGGHCIKIHNSTHRLYSTHWMRTCNFINPG